MTSISINNFLKCKVFLVIGASIDRNKFGNKVVRCYQQFNLPVIPINKRETKIEGLNCLDSISTYQSIISDTNYNNINNYPIEKDISKIGISIITPPGVTSLLLDEALNLGYKHIFLQPGTYDNNLLKSIELDSKWSTMNIIFNSCILVELGYEH
mmetsp:Transcript_15532/g.14064  ORF Transcript_15532/g.14064 Transcript_15532/m.14064 type:complete len:155 (+) Transcript_15532:19-483(+)